MAKDLIPLAESTNAGEAVMSTDYDDKWEFFMGFRKKKKYRTVITKNISEIGINQRLFITISNENNMPYFLKWAQVIIPINTK